MNIHNCFLEISKLCLGKVEVPTGSLQVEMGMTIVIEHDCNVFSAGFGRMFGRDSSDSPHINLTYSSDLGLEKQVSVC